MVLGMVINIGRHANRKVKLQNAADATTYTGSGVVARSMNTLAFTNHLLCDVFAVTAYLREARDRNAEELYPPILDAWVQMAPKFQGAPLPKFSRLAQGIPRKAPMEPLLISVFSEQNAAISEQLLPVVEEILSYEMIPEFQRALVDATPDLANQAANEIAGRHGPSNRGLNRGETMQGLMWRTDAQPFGYATLDGLPQLPAADPVNDTTQHKQAYFRDAVEQRRDLSNRYLSWLNATMLRGVDGSKCRYGKNGVAKMSQFGNLWRGFTRGYLKELLEEEYPRSNLLYQIRKADFYGDDLEKDYFFIGVVYWKQMKENMPGLFRNPLDADSLAFAEAQLFIPSRRIVEDLQPPDPEYIYKRIGGPTHRDLLNQNWDVRLVPAMSEAIVDILQTNPPGSGIETPNLRGLELEDFRMLTTH